MQGQQNWKIEIKEPAKGREKKGNIAARKRFKCKRPKKDMQIIIFLEGRILACSAYLQEKQNKQITNLKHIHECS